MNDAPHSHHPRGGPLMALGSAFLFGASTPIAKLLLGVTDPLLLAGLLYLGSAIRLALATAIRRSVGAVQPEAPIRARDLPWLAAIVLFDGILGPALLMSGLALTPASSAALLLNTEGLATMAIAWLVFRENVDRRIFLGAWRSLPPGRRGEAPIPAQPGQRADRPSLRLVGHRGTPRQNRARAAETGKRHQRLRAGWREETEEHWNKVPMTVLRLALEVWRAIKDEDWVLNAGTLNQWARKLWNFDRPYRHAGRELGTGTLIGTSLGVALANKGTGRLVVDLQPDGDLMYDAGAL